ncbi:MAG: hypothetical protein LBI95_04330 [Holosporales bacterium]|nr:hypothetical protein [Holosporales bacterium]
MNFKCAFLLVTAISSSAFSSSFSPQNDVSSRYKNEDIEELKSMIRAQNAVIKNLTESVEKMAVATAGLYNEMVATLAGANSVFLEEAKGQLNNLSSIFGDYVGLVQPDGSIMPTLESNLKKMELNEPSSTFQSNIEPEILNALQG